MPVHSACWHLPSRLWASCQSSACSQSWLPLTLRNWDCAFHTTTFPSAWGWVQHLCHASTRCQLFLCISAPAEHKTVLRYYPWCSQYFGCSDLRANIDINQCWKIISCCEDGVSAHRGDEAACPGTPAPTILALLHEALLSIMWQRTSFTLFLSYGAAKVHFILLLAS